MQKDNQDINYLVNNAITESNQFLEIYKYKLSFFESKLNKLEKSRCKKNSNLYSYEMEKKEILNSIEVCKNEIKEESDMLNLLLKTKKSNN